MKKILALSAFLFLVMGPMAQAAPVDAKEVARLNNCPTKKIEVVKQSLGPEGSTLYHVDCVMPKTKDEAAQGPDALLIQCTGSLCTVVRSVVTEKK